MSQNAAVLEKLVYEEAPETLKEFLMYVLKARSKNVFKLNDSITYLGRGEPVLDQILQDFSLGSNFTAYARMVKDGCLYATDKKINVKSNNSVAVLMNGSYVSLYSFVVDKENKIDYVLCKNLEIDKHNLCNGMDMLKVVKKIDDRIFKIKTDEIKSVCARFKVENVLYVCELPNLLNY